MNKYVFINSSVDAGIETRVRTPGHGENVDDVGIARGREGRTQAPGGPGSRARPRSTS